MVSEAYAACLRDARAHYENFPVASLLVPAGMRPHIAAVYAFARAADDFADEGRLHAAERFALLDGWLVRLHQAARSTQPGPERRAGEPPHAREIFVALGHSIRTLRLPLSLFEDLLSAFRQDVTVSRYARWTDVLDYCRRSANPVGRLVLRIAGRADEQRDRWSDAICTALQLTNFWQDLRIDHGRGRIYLPDEERRLHGAREEDLTDGRITPGWQQALRAACRRTRDLFAAGRPLCDTFHGRLRYELRATWLGGVRVLDALERSDFDALHARPRLGPRDAAVIAWQVVRWRAGGLKASGYQGRGVASGEKER
jgi:phytoene synthase